MVPQHSSFPFVTFANPPTCHAVAGGCGPSWQAYLLSPWPAGVVSQVAVRSHAVRGTVTTVEVGGAHDPEAEPNVGVAMVTSVGADGREGRGRREGDVCIHIIHMIVEGNVLVSHTNIKLKSTLYILYK